MTAVALGVSVRSDTASLAAHPRSGGAAAAMIESTGQRALGANVLFGVGGAIAAAGVALAIAF